VLHIASLSPVRRGTFARVGRSLAHLSPRALNERRRLRARRRAADEELLHTEWVSPFLAWRVNELLARKNRVELARSLRDLVASSQPRYLPGAAPVDRVAVRAEATSLLALATRLEGPDPVAPRGVLLVDRLLVDGLSPLYCRGEDGALASCLDTARHALEPR
jgi:hypothetical protein